MTGCVQQKRYPLTVGKMSPRAGLEPGTAKSVGQRLTICFEVNELVKLSPNSRKWPNQKFGLTFSGEFL